MAHFHVMRKEIKASCSWSSMCILCTIQVIMRIALQKRMMIFAKQQSSHPPFENPAQQKSCLQQQVAAMPGPNHFKKRDEKSLKFSASCRVAHNYYHQTLICKFFTKKTLIQHFTANKKWGGLSSYFFRLKSLNKTGFLSAYIDL